LSEQGIPNETDMSAQPVEKIGNAAERDQVADIGLVDFATQHEEGVRDFV
jgi:hypothetical protein